MHIILWRLWNIILLAAVIVTVPTARPPVGQASAEAGTTTSSS